MLLKCVLYLQKSTESCGKVLAGLGWAGLATLSWECEWVSEVAQLCPTLCNPMNCSPPGSPIHGIFQARILEWATISFSRGSSWPRDWTEVSRIVGRHFTVWATREVRPESEVSYFPGRVSAYSQARVWLVMSYPWMILFVWLQSSVF